MPHSLPELARRREVIAQQIAQLGDLRPGCVTGTSGRCGKPSCRCHQPGEAAHGPHFRLTYKVDGKTTSESLPTPAAIRKAEREVAEFRKFQELSREFVETNTAICRLRPAQDEAQTDQEKNGGSDPAGGHARSRSALAGGFSGSAQDRMPRSGSHRDGRTLGPAPGGRPSP